MFSELLGNALEHGGADVRIALRRDEGRVLLEVSDDGKGKGDRSTAPASRSSARSSGTSSRGELTLEDDGGLRAIVSFPT